MFVPLTMKKGFKDTLSNKLIRILGTYTTMIDRWTETSIKNYKDEAIMSIMSTIWDNANMEESVLTSFLENVELKLDFNYNNLTRQYEIDLYATVAHESIPTIMVFQE